MSWFEPGPRCAEHHYRRRHLLACGCEACNLSTQRARRRARQQGDLGDELLDDGTAERVEIFGHEDERAGTADDIVLIIFLKATGRVSMLGIPRHRPIAQDDKPID